MIEKFFTTEQVANILQVHPLTILKFIKQGKLKGVKIGRVYRIQESSVQEFLEERMTGDSPKNISSPQKEKAEEEIKEVKKGNPAVIQSKEVPTATKDPDEKTYYII